MKTFIITGLIVFIVTFCLAYLFPEHIVLITIVCTAVGGIVGGIVGAKLAKEFLER